MLDKFVLQQLGNTLFRCVLHGERTFFEKEENEMNEKMYFEIFNKITDMIEELKNLQIQMEEIYLNK